MELSTVIQTAESQALGLMGKILLEELMSVYRLAEWEPAVFM